MQRTPKRATGRHELEHLSSDDLRLIESLLRVQLRDIHDPASRGLALLESWVEELAATLVYDRRAAVALVSRSTWRLSEPMRS